MTVGVSKHTANRLQTPGTSQQANTAGLAGCIRFSAQAADAATLSSQEVTESLAPVMQRRWNQTAAADRKMSAFTTTDIDDYATYMNQSWLVRTVHRFFIGLFQPWRKTPALVHLRDNLMKEMLPQGVKSEKDARMKDILDIQFHKALGPLYRIMSQMGQFGVSDTEDRQLLVAGLKSGAKARRTPLEPQTLYSQMFKYFAGTDIKQPPAGSPFNFRYFMKSHAQGILDLPKDIQGTFEEAKANGTEQQLMAQAPEPKAPKSFRFIPNHFEIVSDGQGGFKVNPKEGGVYPNDGSGDGEEFGGDAPFPKLQEPDFFRSHEVMDLADRTFQNPNQHMGNPTCLMGDIADQKDVLTLFPLINNSAYSNFTHALVFQDKTDTRFHHRFDDLPVDSNRLIHVNEFPPNHPLGQNNDLIKVVKKKMLDLEALANEKKHPMVLYLIGREEMQDVLSELPRLSEKCPNVKVVVAGMKEVPISVAPEAREQLEILKIKPPTMDDAIQTFHMKQAANDYTAVKKIEGSYHVAFKDTALERVVRLLADAGNRPPNTQQILNRLERIAKWSSMDTEVNQERYETYEAEKASRLAEDEALSKAGSPPAKRKALTVVEKPPEVTAIDAARVNRFEHLHQAAMKNNLGVSSGMDAGFVRTNVRFEDIKGLDREITRLKHEAELLKSYHLFKGLRESQGVDSKISRLLIFTGPPGTGKTMTAEAIAAEAGVKFLRVDAPALIKKWVGDTAKAVKDIYEVAGKNQPCVVFLDEVDSIGAERTGEPGGAREIQNGLNQLLLELNNSNHQHDGVMTIVATNRDDLLDEAFKSRQSMMVRFKLPDAKTRAEILKVHARLSGRSFDKSIQWDELAQEAKDPRNEAWSGRFLELLITRTANHSLSQMADVLKEFREQANPDYAALSRKMPVITQEMLKTELNAIKREQYADESYRQVGLGAIMDERALAATEGRESTR